MNDSAVSDHLCDELLPLLYRSNDLVLSFSPSSIALKKHYHGAAELVIALQREVSCELNPARSVSADSILIPPGVAHKNTHADSVSVTIYFDSDSRYYSFLSKNMVHTAGVFVSMPRESEFQTLVRSILLEEPALRACEKSLQEYLTGNPGEQSDELDSRVQWVLEDLRKNPTETNRIGYYAERVGLSEDRLHHVFTEAVGLPLHRYRLWLRLKHASKLCFAGHQLTYAAHNSGFADAAHFSRTFKTMYGASPSVTLMSRKFSRHHYS